MTIGREELDTGRIDLTAVTTGKRIRRLQGVAGN